ncbi:MAG: transporter substrate-binding domain-containing protein, partial [Anaerolineae bacterium]|nr:transporter substrate-binding domain-containing protein [Anaerolineae bacterium]
MINLGGETVTVAVENAYPPFNMIDPKTNEGVGWDYDAVREICKRL